MSDRQSCWNLSELGRVADRIWQEVWHSRPPKRMRLAIFGDVAFSVAVSNIRTRVLWSLLFLSILTGAILRIARFPHGNSPTETDEIGYLSDGLLLLEGETPIHKYAPSGPLTWFSAWYAAIRTVVVLFSGGSDVSVFPALVRPAAALEASLFYLYADMSSLRLTAVALTVLLTLLAVAAAFWLGKAFLGTLGAVAAGLMAASLPSFVELSTEARPYAIAWASGLIALAAAGTNKPRSQLLSAGIFLGLAIGSHIDMLRIAPLVLLLQWRRSGNGVVPWHDFYITLITSLICFLIIAPWYELHLIDNIRQIITVRMMGAEHTSLLSLWLGWLDAGIALPLVVTIAGLLMALSRRRWPEFCCGIWLVLNTAIAAYPSAHGIHHDGAWLVMVIALLPLGLSIIFDMVPVFKKPALASAIAVIIVAPTMWRGGAQAFAEGRSLNPDQAIDWVEKNVTPGTTIFVEGSGTRSLLPTRDATTRLWTDVAAPDAWVPKYLHDVTKFGLGSERPLRVMSSDRIASDRGNRRRYYILGAPLQPERPRYDLWIVSYGSFYDVPPPIVIERLCQDGGIYIHSGSKIDVLPLSVASWPRDDGDSTYIYRVNARGCYKSP
jgi:hypothetical protein